MDQGRAILIIDDEEIMRVASRTILEDAGFSVYEAADGNDGIVKAIDVLPNLVLCDIEMPGKNGFEVLEMFRANAATASIPFVFLTGQSGRSMVRKGMELGADDFLTKPFTSDELLSTVNSRLQRRARIQEEADGKLNELRHSISSSVPHELRTPLTGILGFGAVLKDQADSLEAEDLRQIADHILGSGQRLQQTLEKFWRYSEITFLATDEAARRRLRLERLEKANSVIRLSAQDRAGVHVRTQDLTLSVDPAVCIPIYHAHLSALMDELVDNAFKFSKAGNGVRVECTGEKSGGFVIITVKDEGRGMTKDQVAQIGGFMQFGRKHHEQQGLGLGFSIARELSRLYGGEISVSSEEGKGTTVTVRLPMCT
jgi:signal transduction histidine kinase